MGNVIPEPLLTQEGAASILIYK